MLLQSPANVLVGLQSPVNVLIVHQATYLAPNVHWWAH